MDWTKAYLLYQRILFHLIFSYFMLFYVILLYFIANLIYYL